MVAMHRFSQIASALLAMAVLAAPVAGLCASLAAPDAPCEMHETPEVASCGHGQMVMAGCCSAESLDPPVDGILSGATDEGDLPAPAASRCDDRIAEAQAVAVLACDGDPPPGVPRYTLFSSLLL